MDEIGRRAQRLAEILPRARARGFRAGINVLATIGHLEENLTNSLQVSWPQAMDPSGRVCRGSYCPAHPEIIDYDRRIYSTLARTNPDFIWIDDDVEHLNHYPVDFTCFCDLCIQQFSGQVGIRPTRQTVVESFDAGSLHERLHFRREWLERNRRVIDNLLRNIEEAIHSIKTDLPIGFMTGDRFYEGYDFARWAKTLAGPRNVPVRWRPGGGFYSDEALLGLVDKAHEVGRQVAALPATVRIIQSETENFFYQPLEKSAQATIIEAAAHMAAGTTGTAFNVLTTQPDPLGEYFPMLERIGKSRPFYQNLQEVLGRSPLRGIWPAWNRDLFITNDLKGKWLGVQRGMPLRAPYVLGEIGIPLCYDPGGRTATALTGAAPFAFKTEELRGMFSGGVLMDVEAWQSLKMLGLEKWTGIAGVNNIDHDATEVLTSHPLNGKFAGWSRDCRQSFLNWWTRAYRLEPYNNHAAILARIVDYGGCDLGPCMTAFMNELGGRVVVMGYYPWSFIHNLSKSTQLKAVSTWISQEQLPVVAESFAKVAIWYREGARRKTIVFLNVSLNPLPKWTLGLSTHEIGFTHVNESGEESHLVGHKIDSTNRYVRVTLPEVDPWSIHLLVD